MNQNLEAVNIVNEVLRWSFTENKDSLYFWIEWGTTTKPDFSKMITK
jgi:hypothetical protein